MRFQQSFTRAQIDEKIQLAIIAIETCERLDLKKGLACVDMRANGPYGGLCSSYPAIKIPFLCNSFSSLFIKTSL
jgi:hypothetical protein